PRNNREPEGGDESGLTRSLPRLLHRPSFADWQTVGAAGSALQGRRGARGSERDRSAHECALGKDLAEDPTPGRCAYDVRLCFPHPLTLLVGFIALAAVMTYVLPAGQFDRRDDPATGRRVVVAGTYHAVPQAPVTPFQAVVAIPRGMAAAAHKLSGFSDWRRVRSGGSDRSTAPRSRLDGAASRA